MEDQKPNNRERVKEIVAGIEKNIQELFQSEKYFDYLRTMSRFHNYSLNNTLLIYAQRPNAETPIAGFQKWKQFGRHVKKGEKGLTIIAPTPLKRKIEEMKRDPDTSAPVLDQDGNPVERSKGGWNWGDSLSIDIVATTQEEYDQIMELYNAVETVTNYDTSIYDIISEMAGSYFTGDKGLDETASLIQGKVQLYINENR